MARDLNVSVACVKPKYQYRPEAYVLMLRNGIRFNGKEFLAIRYTPKLEDHPLSASRYCLFNIFAAIIYIGGLWSIRKLRKRHAVVACQYSNVIVSI